MNQSVKIAARQITKDNETLRLNGVMQMTLLNFGRDMYVDINGILFPLLRSEQISLPSGLGNVYGSSSFIVLRAMPKNIIEKLFYMHPDIAAGAWTLNKDEVYPLDPYGNWITDRNGVDALINSINCNSYFTGKNIAGIWPIENIGERSVWLSPMAFGLGINYDIKRRWETFTNTFTGVPSSLEWVREFFNNLNWQKVKFINNEFTNITDPETIVSLLAGFELAEFKARISETWDDFKSLWVLLGGKVKLLLTLQTNIDNWQAAVQTKNEYFEITYDANGQAVETPISAIEYNRPIDVKVIYTNNEILAAQKRL